MLGFMNPRASPTSCKSLRATFAQGETEFNSLRILCGWFLRPLDLNLNRKPGFSLAIGK
jgi:hypothetical protein